MFSEKTALIVIVLTLPGRFYSYQFYEIPSKRKLNCILLQNVICMTNCVIITCNCFIKHATCTLTQVSYSQSTADDVEFIRTLRLIIATGLLRCLAPW